MFQYVYSTLFPKYFCRVDGYDIRNKLAFEVAHAGYQNQKENLRLLHWQQQQQQQQIVSIKQEKRMKMKRSKLQLLMKKRSVVVSSENKKKKKIVDNAEKSLLKKKKEIEKSKTFRWIKAEWLTYETCRF